MSKEEKIEVGDGPDARASISTSHERDFSVRFAWRKREREKEEPQCWASNKT